MPPKQVITYSHEVSLAGVAGLGPNGHAQATRADNARIERCQPLLHQMAAPSHRRG